VFFQIRAAHVSVFLTAAIFLSLLTSVVAQPNAKVWRIGYLDPSSSSVVSPFLQSFRQEMARLGWTEGKNIALEYRFADLKLERMPELAADLINWKADVILAAGGGPSSARKLTATVPIVVASGVDLVHAGLRKALRARAGM
jgi:putative ABC transport system substrate-binding protein